MELKYNAYKCGLDNNEEKDNNEVAVIVFKFQSGFSSLLSSPHLYALYFISKHFVLS